MTRTYFRQVENTLSRMEYAKVKQIVEGLREVREWSGTVYTMGNGGSAATASHFANDLMKMGGIKTVCISDMTPTTLAYGNDDGWHKMFQYTLGHLIADTDMVFAISCSGNSKNIVNCVKPNAFSLKPLFVVGLTGQNGGFMARFADIAVKVPHPDIRIQEDVHSVICHAIAGDLSEKHTHIP